MPLTDYQRDLARLLAKNRTPDSHLAGGAALNLIPNAKRYSNDLDYFHDSVERVASAFADDQELLSAEGYALKLELQQPGYVRAIVSKGSHSTKVEWAHDSAWRFMPAVESNEVGYQLHPIDLAINKVLALAGRDEPRDYLDVITCHQELLPLGALCWAAAGKDPGFTPASLLELIKRRGKYRPEDFERLHLIELVDVRELKRQWLEAIESAQTFVEAAAPTEAGCLYYDLDAQRFVAPTKEQMSSGRIKPHYGRPGGILPRVPDEHQLR